MRKIALSFLFLCLAAITHAQIKKGSVYLGGCSISHASIVENRSNPLPSGDNEGKLTASAFSPAFGIAVKNNLIAGIDVTYAKANYERIQNVSAYDAKAIGAGVFFRKFFPLANKLYAFGQLRAGYEFSDAEQKSSFNPNERTVIRGWGLNASVYPGITYNVVGSLYLEAGFNNLFLVSYEKEKEENFLGSGSTVYTEERKSFAISSSLANPSNITSGVRIIFPKK